MMIWCVAVGSAAGGALRYWLGGLVQRMAGGAFPAGTLFVNVTGSFLLGFLMRYALASQAITPEVRAMLTIGLCGGYTTFSTFSYDTVGLLEHGDYRRAVLYVVLSLVGSLVGIVVGLMLARGVLGMRTAVGQ